MEQVTSTSWPFDVPPGTIVVTSTFVTERRMPILYVTHEHDEREGIIWQFHCGNNDYDPSVLLLVRLDEILALDASLAQVAQVPVGFCARRSTVDDAWRFEREHR
jgi:hypothetical protein